MVNNNVENEQISYHDRILELGREMHGLTVSLVQRRFRLGYGVTLQLMKELEESGAIERVEAESKWVLRESSTATEGRS